MTKIVSIVWYKVLPARFGGQKGIASFNNYLARIHPLVCLCSSSNEAVPDLPYRLIPKLPTSKWQFLQPSCWNLIRQTILDEKATHVIIEHPYYGLAAVRARRSTGAKLIVHSHNIESERFREMGKWWWKLLHWYEGWTYRQADLNLFKTADDLQWAVRHFGVAEKNCLLLPYGAEPEAYREKSQAQDLVRAKHAIRPDEKILLFAGTLDYPPNARAVKAIVSELAPRLSAQGLKYRIIICGRNQLKEKYDLDSMQHPQVTMAGEVEDIGTYFDAADVFINPVLEGGGIQTKNMDALAHHCNVVCFDRMTDHKLRITAGAKLFCCQNGDWDGFVTHLQLAIKYEGLTPHSFFETYNWGGIIRNLTEKMRSLDQEDT